MPSSSNTNNENNNENNNQDIEEGRSSTANIDNDQSNQPRSIVGLELIDNEDDSDLPLPVGMAEEISNAAEPPKQICKVEQIDDNDGPEPPAAMLEASLNAAEKSNDTIRASLESIDDEFNTPPTPFNSTIFEQDAIAKDNNEEEIPPSDRDSIHNIPSNNEEKQY